MVKLASYSIGGRDTYGIVSGDAVSDLGKRTGIGSLRELIATKPEAIAEHADAAGEYALADISFLPPIPDAGMVVCMGLNTYSHLEEFRAANNNPDAPPPPKPWTFLRLPRSLTGHGQDIVRPNVSPLLDFEGEIALIIGKHARHLNPDNAMDCVYGYSCVNEGSVRDFQIHSQLYTSGKNFPRSGSFGPWIVTADEIGDYRKLKLTTKVNGSVVQTMDYDDLIYGFPEMLSYISSFTELHPGDVVVTGTAAGVGAMREPKLWLAPGDTCEVEVTGIGTLSNTIAEAQGSDRGPVTCDDTETAMKAAMAFMKK